MIKQEDVMVNEKGQLVLLFSPRENQKRVNEVMGEWGFESYTENTCGNPNTFIKFSVQDSNEIRKKLSKEGEKNV